MDIECEQKHLDYTIIMDYKTTQKLMEIQYLKGRLDELYKGYVPNLNSTDNRIVDTRISKYEDKLMAIDEIAFHLYNVERQNVSESKRKSKKAISALLTEIREALIDNDWLGESDVIIQKINKQLNTY